MTVYRKALGDIEAVSCSIVGELSSTKLPLILWQQMRAEISFIASNEGRMCDLKIIWTEWKRITHFKAYLFYMKGYVPLVALLYLGVGKPAKGSICLEVRIIHLQYGHLKTLLKDFKIINRLIVEWEGAVLLIGS